MSRLLIAGAVALAAVLPVAPAVAQSGFSEPSITVTAPRMRNEGRTSSGVPIRTVETDSVVYLGDLDLRHRADRRELDLRVEAAADEACGFLEQHYPSDFADTTPRECRNNAVETAQAQVRDAVQRSALYDTPDAAAFAGD